jgi:hypothetical protein
MKNTLLKIYIVSFFLISDVVLFAQGGDPGTDDGGGGLEGDGDETPVPINGKLLWLAIAGVVLAIYTYRKHRKTIQA